LEARKTAARVDNEQNVSGALRAIAEDGYDACRGCVQRIVGAEDRGTC
jgi:Na+-translocating ferredoxin:NAD+ oxidoreductase RnfG subunit